MNTQEFKLKIEDKILSLTQKRDKIIQNGGNLHEGGTYQDQIEILYWVLQQTKALSGHINLSTTNEYTRLKI